MYKEYAKLDAQIKALEAKKQEMRLSIVKGLEKQGIESEVTKFGTFTVAEKKTYTYSDKITALAEKVKLAKIREEDKGIATASIATYLVFNAPKN